MILEAFSHGKFFQAALEVIQVAFLYSFAVVAKFQLALCACAVAELLVSCHRAVDSLLWQLFLLLLRSVYIDDLQKIMTARIAAALIDLSGTLLIEDSVIPGAVEALRR